jgi:hypothetical protein
VITTKKGGLPTTPSAVHVPLRNVLTQKEKKRPGRVKRKKMIEVWVTTIKKTRCYGVFSTTATGIGILYSSIGLDMLCSFVQ